MKTVNEFPGESKEIAGEGQEKYNGLLSENNPESKDDSVEEEARKDQLSGPANDLISQPDGENDKD